MAIFRGIGRLFGKGEPATEHEAEVIEALKQIELETKRLEEQWEEKIKEFSLFKIKWGYGGWHESSPANFSSGVYRAPNKHFRRLWQDFIKLNKKTLALEHCMRLLKKMDPHSVRQYKKMGKLRRIIHKSEADLISHVGNYISEFKETIEVGRQKERKYMSKLYMSSWDPKKSWDDLPDHTKIELRRISDDLFKNHVHYDFEERMKFFDHLEKECRRLRERVLNLKAG